MKSSQVTFKSNQVTLKNKHSIMQHDQRFKLSLKHKTNIQSFNHIYTQNHNESFNQAGARFKLFSKQWYFIFSLKWDFTKPVVLRQLSVVSLLWCETERCCCFANLRFIHTYWLTLKCIIPHTVLNYNMLNQNNTLKKTKVLFDPLPCRTIHFNEIP